MDNINLNKKAWDAIGKKVASPYMKNDAYLTLFEMFCSMLSKGAKVLDLGCGPGIPVTKILVDRGFSVVALDFSKSMISLVKENVPAAEPVHMSITEIDYENEFEGIVASYSLLCLNPEQFNETIRKISAALKRGGVFFLALNEPDGPVPDNYEHIEELIGQTMYTRGYTEDEIRDMLSGTPFSVTRVARGTVTSKEFGTEHSLIMLLKKD